MKRKSKLQIKKTHVSANSPKLIPTLLGSLVLLIVTGLLLNIFIFGLGTTNSEHVRAAVTETITLIPKSPSDYINEDGQVVQTYTQSPGTVWLGTGQNVTTSFLGLRFTADKAIPAGSQVISASLDLVPKQDTWIGLNTTLYAETAIDPQPFSLSSKPSQRAKTTTNKVISDNVKWLANNHYKYDVTSIIQSLPNSSDRKTISILAQGGKPQWGRKYVLGGLATDTTPRLTIVYRTSGEVVPTKPTVPSVPPSPTSLTQPTSGQISPTAKPTPTSQPQGNTGGGTSTGVAASFGLWDPADAKYAAAGPQKYATCTKAFHDSFYVIATDGKKYPTWHPPVAVDPATGVKCSFGHEHGANPAQSAIWNQVQQHFYYDANKNGVMDASEKAVAGVPFGYANEQLDIYSASKNLGYMRHEDHVGHKVEWANAEADMDGGTFNSNTTGGVIVPLKQNSGDKWVDFGARCYYFSKVHQGVSTFDAFTNNLHEVIFFADCKGPSTAYDQKAAITQMVAFGAPGEFTNLCDPGGDRSSPVVLGKDAMNQNWPGTRDEGFRAIIQRSCIENYFLVPSGKFSMNMYEAWATSMRLQTTSGKTVLSGVNLTFDVEEANRYYYPGKPNNVGYAMDLCYERLANGNEARGGTCGTVTNYGQIKGITWNDTRSGFKGIHRGMYFQGPTLSNAGGSEVLYTDPYGRNGQSTPFAGSVKQVLSAKNVNYGDFGVIDPRQNDHVFDDGEGTVHGPN